MSARTTVDCPSAEIQFQPCPNRFPHLALRPCGCRWKSLCSQHPYAAHIRNSRPRRGQISVKEGLRARRGVLAPPKFRRSSRYRVENVQPPVQTWRPVVPCSMCAKQEMPCLNVTFTYAWSTALVATVHRRHLHGGGVLLNLRVCVHTMIVAYGGGIRQHLPAEIMKNFLQTKSRGGTVLGSGKKILGNIKSGYGECRYLFRKKTLYPTLPHG